MRCLKVLLVISLAPAMIAATQAGPMPARNEKPAFEVELKQTKVICNQLKDSDYQCQSDIQECYDVCYGEYLVSAVGCSALPPPWSAICHTENADNLGGCFRRCRGT